MSFMRSVAIVTSLIAAQSSLPLQLKEFGARVVGMPYNVFIGAMLDPISNAATFSALKSADLILGGPALNEDFR